MSDAVRGTRSISGRRATRRAVSLECEIFSDQWEEPVSLRATNLSHLGLWVQTQLPLDVGEEVIVSLTPPRWPLRTQLVALAMVARVGLFRRRRDIDDSGMGLAFADLDAKEVRMLAGALRGLPPPLPKKRAPNHIPVPAVEPQAPNWFDPILRLADGAVYRFVAEGALLTGHRTVRRPGLRLVYSRGSSRGGIQVPPTFRQRIAA